MGSETQNNIFIPVKIKVACPDCKGAGYTAVEHSTPNVEYICSKCKGNGKLFKNKTIDIETLKEILNAREKTSTN